MKMLHIPWQFIYISIIYMGCQMFSLATLLGGSYLNSPLLFIFFYLDCVKKRDIIIWYFITFWNPSHCSDVDKNIMLTESLGVSSQEVFRALRPCLVVQEKTKGGRLTESRERVCQGCAVSSAGSSCAELAVCHRPSPLNWSIYILPSKGISA